MAKMLKIWLDWSDGRYSTRLLTDEEAAEREAKDFDVVYIEDGAWRQYERHCDRDAAWQAHWRAISNEQAMRRREKELMPLEDAEREIRLLKDDLAQARRMWKFYEDEDTRRRQGRHREEYIKYTCVYPQAGCDIEALPLPWRESALEILEAFNAERAAEGLKYQGCCCGHEHLLLDEEAVVKLRTAGFVVENDTEEL